MRRKAATHGKLAVVGSSPSHTTKTPHVLGAQNLTTVTYVCLMGPRGSECRGPGGMLASSGCCVQKLDFNGKSLHLAGQGRFGFECEASLKDLSFVVRKGHLHSEFCRAVCGGPGEATLTVQGALRVGSNLWGVRVPNPDRLSHGQCHGIAASRAWRRPRSRFKGLPPPQSPKP